MNKLEAIQAMREGKKVTHDYFSQEEWMTMKSGKILLEDGVVCDTDEFWRWRKADNWNEGWRLVDENNKQLVKADVMHPVCVHPITYATYTKFCQRKCLLCGKFI